MRKRVLRLVTILTLLGAAFSVTTWPVSVLRRQTSVQEAQSDSKNKRKTLREIAQERDVEFHSDRGESENEYHDFSSLARDAEAIVLGRIVEAEASFEGNDYVVTNYLINVQRVLKDTKLNAPQLEGQRSPAPLATPLKFRRIGGAVNVSGHRASVSVKGQEALVMGKDYIFFFWWSSDYNSYYLAGGISGAVLVEDNLSVKPLGTQKKMRKYDDAHLEAFINEALKNQ